MFLTCTHTIRVEARGPRWAVVEYIDSVPLGVLATCRTPRRARKQAFSWASLYGGLPVHT